MVGLARALAHPETGKAPGLRDAGHRTAGAVFRWCAHRDLLTLCAFSASEAAHDFPLLHSAFFLPVLRSPSSVAGLRRVDRTAEGGLPSFRLARPVRSEERRVG